MEEWLGKVEEAMFASLRKLIKASIGDYDRTPREEWVLQHASQVKLLRFVNFHQRNYSAVQIENCGNFMFKSSSKSILLSVRQFVFLFLNGVASV